MEIQESALAGDIAEAVQADTLTMIKLTKAFTEAESRSLNFRVESLDDEYINDCGLWSVPIFEIDDPRLIRDGNIQVPTKIFITLGSDGYDIPDEYFLHLIFFAGDMLPPHTRPFKEKLYIACVHATQIDNLYYRASDRMLIDQIVVGNDIWYIFAFDVNTAKTIVGEY